MYVQSLLTSINDRGHLTGAYQTHLAKVKELLTKKIEGTEVSVQAPKDEAPKTKTTIVKGAVGEF
jgi:hypothetical protein